MTTDFRLEPLELGFGPEELTPDDLTIPMAFVLTIRGVITRQGFDLKRTGPDGEPQSFWVLEHDQELEELFDEPTVEFLLLPLYRQPEED